MLANNLSIARANSWRKKLLASGLLLFSYILLHPQASATKNRAPLERAHHSGVYDPSRNGFVIYGGFIFKDNKPEMTGDVWNWDGKKWKEIARTNTSKIIAPMAFDDKRGRLLMFGGADTSGNEDGKLSVFQNNSWHVLMDSQVMARGDAGLVYDKKRDRLVLFGGVHNDNFLGDTWEFDGRTWKRVSEKGPEPRSGVAMTYDNDRGVTVLYGGFKPGTAFNDTWEWNGKLWKQILAEGPGPRSWPCIAYDSRIHQSILFGGEDMHDHFYNDTWCWDGKTWKQITTTGPPGRIQFVMDYDPRRSRIVLFGGFGMPSHYSNDTWEFDGKAWIEKNK
ncbi:MAG: kelch repeat-containing protein [Chitinophagaceae bacterium]